jgi:hypothetical protein
LSPHRRRDFTLGLASALATLGLALLLVAAYWRAQDTRTFAEQTVRHCRQIEALKTEIRRTAIQNFRNLKRDAELLGIDITSQLRAAARDSRDDKLHRFRPNPC